MSWEAAEALATTLLYEGYALYPYRATALKNQRRWAFGSLYPPAFCREDNDRSAAAFACFVRGDDPHVRVRLRFLQGVERLAPGEPPWHESLERAVSLGPLRLRDLVDAPRDATIAFPGEVRRDATFERRTFAVHGALRVSASIQGASVFAVRVAASNDTAFLGDDRDAAHLRALGAAHVVAGCDGGRLVSRTAPDADLAAASECLPSEGLWPALVGLDGRALLASPIIVEDQASIARESPGDLFDSTEMDEMLALRIRTLADDERVEAIATDARVRALVERTEALDADAIGRLHGAWRAPVFHVGDRVHLRPRAGGDVLDLALAGERATIVRVDHDLEGRAHYAVTVDADPGRDLGEAGHPGHRFYFAPEELERCP